MDVSFTRKVATDGVDASVYPRDMVGYGRQVPTVVWPGGAKLAVNFVLNYEEGSERSVLHGDRESETFLSEMGAPEAFKDRHLSMESLYEYGSRAGVWRLLRLFDQFEYPLTIFAVAQAMQRNPQVVKAFVERGDEIASHGYRWLSYQEESEEVERDHLEKAMTILTDLTGSRPLGWYTGRDSPRTRQLVVDYGGFLYDSDNYGDDLPFWERRRRSSGEEVDHLVIPYTLDANDMNFSSPTGFTSGDQFTSYLIDTFDTLYAEGVAGSPKMMTVGMHCRILGRPARTAALRRFLSHVRERDDVWVTRRVEIARYWRDKMLL